MNTQLLSNDPIYLDIGPMTMDVYTLNRFGRRPPGTPEQLLHIDREGFRLVDKKGNTHSKVAWSRLDNLKNEIREKGRFSYFGTVITAFGDMQGIIRIGLGDNPEQRERLAAVFDRLPREASGDRCPACGGAIVDNVCKSCHRTLTGQRRRKGLSLILIGSIPLILGIVGTVSSYNAATGSIRVYYYAIILGAGLVISGLIGLIFGRRT